MAATAAAFAARRTGSAIVAARAAVTVASAMTAAAVAAEAAATTAIASASAAIAAMSTAVTTTAETTAVAARLAGGAFTRGCELLFGRGREQRLAGETDLAGVRLDADHLYLDLVADLEEIG
ncbi:MAG TPA: hypothetical protein VGR95_00185, partial [Thermoanaerobaculia bacterium]|nr:hypothetical protein [Thermoanaerobaculia bacterium]